MTSAAKVITLECRRFEVPPALPHAREGTSNRKAARDPLDLPVPLCVRSSCQRVLRPITNFGSGARGDLSREHERHHIAAAWGLHAVGARARSPAQLRIAAPAARRL